MEFFKAGSAREAYFIEFFVWYRDLGLIPSILLEICLHFCSLRAFANEYHHMIYVISAEEKEESKAVADDCISLRLNGAKFDWRSEVPCQRFVDVVLDFYSSFIDVLQRFAHARQGYDIPDLELLQDRRLNGGVPTDKTYKIEHF